MSNKINAQWCDEHWEEIRSTFKSPIPINGILFSIEMMNHWINIKDDELGDAMPRSSDTKAINSLMMKDAPICCYLPRDVFEVIKSTCILPMKYRDLPPKVGHKLHLMETKFG